MKLEMPQKKQADLEEKVVEKADNLLKDCIGELAEMNCEADIFLRGRNYYLVFETGFERVIACVTPSGRYAIELECLDLAA